MQGGRMRKTIMILLSTFFFLSVNFAGAVSTDIAAMKDSIEVHQTTPVECMAGTVYLMSVCSLADGDVNKILDLMYLYGIPCLYFNGITGDDEMSFEMSFLKCLFGNFYVMNVCVACDGDVLKCIMLSLSTYYAPCLLHATSISNDFAANE
jgi:hypothetical protein